MKMVNSDTLASEILKKECILTDTMRRTGYAVFTSDIMKTISDVEVVDAVPVVHGRWIPHEDEDGEHYGDKCSKCGEWYVMPYGKTNYCPHCGAKMDGKGDGNG